MFYFDDRPVNLFVLMLSFLEARVGPSQIVDMLRIMFHPSLRFISRLPFVIRFVTPVNKRPM